MLKDTDHQQQELFLLGAAGWLLTKFSGFPFDESHRAGTSASARAEILLLRHRASFRACGNEGPPSGTHCRSPNIFTRSCRNAVLLACDRRLRRIAARSREIHSGGSFTTSRLAAGQPQGTIRRASNLVRRAQARYRTWFARSVASVSLATSVGAVPVRRRLDCGRI